MPLARYLSASPASPTSPTSPTSLTSQPDAGHLESTIKKNYNDYERKKVFNP